MVVVQDSDSEENSGHCSTNEVWYKCLPICDRTCETLGDKCTNIADLNKYKQCKPGCDCRLDYVRLTKRGPCHHYRKCPSKSPYKLHHFTILNTFNFVLFLMNSCSFASYSAVPSERDLEELRKVVRREMWLIQR